MIKLYVCRDTLDKDFLGRSAAHYLGVQPTLRSLQCLVDTLNGFSLYTTAAFLDANGIFIVEYIHTYIHTYIHRTYSCTYSILHTYIDTYILYIQYAVHTYILHKHTYIHTYR